MPLDNKNLIWRFWGHQTFKPGGLPKSKLLASSQPDRWPQDAKTFKFNVLDPKTSNS